MKKQIFFILCVVSFQMYSQIDNQQLGRAIEQNRYYGNYYDLSDPNTINIKVSVWGYAQTPGRYLVPISTTIKDLISYAGGPDVNANLDDLRLYRINQNGEEEILTFDYSDLMEEGRIRSNKNRNPDLIAGDILILPGSPKYFFRDWLAITLSIFSALVSLTILIINISRN